MVGLSICPLAEMDQEFRDRRDLLVLKVLVAHRDLQARLVQLETPVLLDLLEHKVLKAT